MLVLLNVNSLNGETILAICNISEKIPDWGVELKMVLYKSGLGTQLKGCSVGRVQIWLKDEVEKMASEDWQVRLRPGAEELANYHCT